MSLAWYGKLPALGDFASRCLSSPALDAIHGWLADGLVGLSDVDKDWQHRFSAAPRWRFAWPRGTLPDVGPLGGTVCGVLVPSQDCSGRRFPLIALQAVDAPLSDISMGWLSRLETVLRLAVAETWSIERFETALELLNRIAPLACDPHARIHERGAPGHTFWWRERGGAFGWCVHDGLPTGGDFTALFDPDAIFDPSAPLPRRRAIETPTTVQGNTQ